MTRKEFIDRIIAIYRLKYKPSDLEVDEFRLLLEMMPDKEPLTISTQSQSPIVINPGDNNNIPWWRDTVVMYGCPMPNSWNDFNKSSSSSTFDSTIEELKLKNDKKE